MHVIDEGKMQSVVPNGCHSPTAQQNPMNAPASSLPRVPSVSSAFSVESETRNVETQNVGTEFTGAVEDYQSIVGPQLYAALIFAVGFLCFPVWCLGLLFVRDEVVRVRRLGRASAVCALLAFIAMIIVGLLLIVNNGAILRGKSEAPTVSFEGTPNGSQNSPTPRSPDDPIFQNPPGQMGLPNGQNNGHPPHPDQQQQPGNPGQQQGNPNSNHKQLPGNPNQQQQPGNGGQQQQPGNGGPHLGNGGLQQQQPGSGDQQLGNGGQQQPQKSQSTTT